MTQEEKAKAYDELFAKAKQIYNKENDVLIMHTIEDLFPELKESEDERVRKALIKFFSTNEKWDDTVSSKDVIAWLEKQGKKKSKKVSIWKHWKDGIAGNGEGEPIYLIKYGRTYRLSSCLGFECDYIELSELDKLKPTNKVEPKFKVGDWVVENGVNKNPVQITSFEEDKESGIRVWFSNGTGTYIEFLKGYHKWTIKDAKPGDVIYLPNGNNEYYIFIFKGIENAAVMSFVHFYQYNDGTSKVEETIDRLSSVNDVFQPATKEQRSILFQKIKEAGYEWDAEKKELKKFKQEPIWEWDAEKKELKKIEEIPTEWSEEDEKIITGIINDIQERLEDYPLEQLAEIYFKEIKWLKSLKQRIGG